MRKSPGIKSSMTEAQFSALLSTSPKTEWYGYGCVVTVSSAISLPAKNWKFRGFKFVRSGSLGTSDTMLALGSTSTGISNSAFTSPISVGSVSKGATTLTGTGIKTGWYALYGSDTVTHTSGSPTYAVKGQLVHVSSVSGSTATLSSPVFMAIGTGNIVPWTPMLNVEFEDCTFDGFNGASAGVQVCLHVGPSVNTKLLRCKFLGFTDSGSRVDFSIGVVTNGCYYRTDNTSSGRYCHQARRTICSVHSNNWYDVARWGATGQGVYNTVHMDNWYYYGLDAGDHGCGGTDNVVKNARLSAPASFGGINIGNPAFLAGGSATIRDCSIINPASTTTDTPIIVYPNGSVTTYNTTVRQLKLQSYPQGSSGYGSAQGPATITLGTGTLVERFAGGGEVIQCLYNGTVNAAGSKLTSLIIEQGAVVSGSTFGGVVRLRGISGSFSVRVQGSIKTTYNNASVPCIEYDSGTMDLNVESGLFETTQSSASSFDIIRIMSGATALNHKGITTGAIASVKTSASTVAATSAQINDGTGGAATVTPIS